MRILVKLVKKVLDLTYYRFLVLIAFYKIMRMEPKSAGFMEYIEFAKSFKVGLPFRGLFLGIEPMQYNEEILPFLEFIKGKQPKVICEIGTASGGTFYLLSKALQAGGVIISIDLPEGEFGAGHSSSKARLLQKIVDKDCKRSYFIRGDSHDPENVARLGEILAGREVDVMLIDGDHRYEGVRRDFENYQKFVKKGGIIAFHDVVEGLPKYVGGVPLFWKEVKVGRICREFVRDWKQGGAGIGVIEVDN